MNYKWPILPFLAKKEDRIPYFGKNCQRTYVTCQKTNFVSWSIKNYSHYTYSKAMLQLVIDRPRILDKNGGKIQYFHQKLLINPI